MSVRAALETLYTDTCTIFGYENQTSGSKTKSVEVAIYENQPCRISFSAVKKSDQSATVGYPEQEIKLFLSPDLDIAEGSRIIVVRNGKTTAYKHSGTAAIYATHQEIVLEIERKYT